jgi:hypothetical protein
MNADGPQTLIEAVKHYADLTVCHNYMVKLKWSDGRIVCPKCGSDKIGSAITYLTHQGPSGLSLARTSRRT